jgi:glycosidase
MKTPIWFKDAIIYQIFIDRFAGYSKKDWKLPQFMGGNIKGIIEKLDYLKELGINTIWISPFYQTNEYHGYSITDFFKMESRFGNLEDLKELIELVHKKEMKIIADFVPNHCSDNHPFFIEAKNDKNSIYAKWFYFKNWPHDYLCFTNVKSLPKLNLENFETREHIINSALYWLEFGLDGYRIDHAIGPKHEFWQELRRKIKKNFPDAILIGEVWMQGLKYEDLETINIRNKIEKWKTNAPSDSLLKEYIDELDGVLDFKFNSVIRKEIAHKDDLEINLELQEHFSKYPKEYYLPTFLDNHDMDRFIFICKNNKQLLKKAVTIQFSIKQPKIIYYGTEIGMMQDKSMHEFAMHGDLQARQTMKWENQDLELLEFYKNIIKESKSNS